MFTKAVRKHCSKKPLEIKLLSTIASCLQSLTNEFVSKLQHTVSNLVPHM